MRADPLTCGALRLAGAHMTCRTPEGIEDWGWLALARMAAPPDALGALAGMWREAWDSERRALMGAALEALGAPGGGAPEIGAVLLAMAELGVAPGPADGYAALRLAYGVAIAFEDGAEGAADRWLWRVLMLFWAMTDIVDAGMEWSTHVPEITEANLEQAVAQECAALLAALPPDARPWIDWAGGLSSR